MTTFLVDVGDISLIVIGICTAIVAILAAIAITARRRDRRRALVNWHDVRAEVNDLTPADFNTPGGTK